MSTPRKPTRGRQTRPSNPASRAASRTKPVRSETSNAALTEQLKELRLPMFRQHFASLAEQAEQEPLSHTQYLAELAELECQTRRESRITRLLGQSQLPSSKTWSNFQWARLPLAVTRQMESLRDGSFLDRRENLLLFGKPGSGKSHLLQGIARRHCLLGYRVRYITSAELVNDLATSRADDTLSRRLRYFGNFDLLAIDEFGFEKLERMDHPQAANLLYKVIEARYPRRSTALVTNIDFDAWGDYLGDPPLAMAFLDRVVDGAIVLKLEGKSYRAHRARRVDAKPPSSKK